MTADPVSAAAADDLAFERKRSSLVRHIAADPVGLSDIADRLGVARQTAKSWNQRGLLPPPKWRASGGPLWDWPTIETWASGRASKRPQVRTAAGAVIVGAV